jgi:hypothetical protein
VNHLDQQHQGERLVEDLNAAGLGLVLGVLVGWVGLDGFQGNGMPRIGKLVSGGQTGVERTALDVALERDIPIGGWCARDRLADDGTLSAAYQPLTELPSEGANRRVHWNIRDSDATLFLSWGNSRASWYPGWLCQAYRKPFFSIDLADEETLPEAISKAREWVAGNLSGRALYVTGPREDQVPGISERTRRILHAILARGN